LREICTKFNINEMQHNTKLCISFIFPLYKRHLDDNVLTGDLDGVEIMASWRQFRFFLSPISNSSNEPRVSERVSDT
jgi:hypothetical protein